MMALKKRSRVALTVVFDALLINAGIVLSFLLRYGGTLPRFNFDPYLRMAVWITLIQLLFIYAFGGYDQQRMADGWNILGALLQAVTFGLLAVVALTFVLRSFSFPRLVFVITWFMQVSLLLAWRLLQLKVAPPNFGDVPVLIVGTGETARHLVREIEKQGRLGYRIVGAVKRDDERDVEEVEGVRVIGKIDEVPYLAATYQVKYIIITIPVRERQLIEDLIRVRRARVRVDVVPDLYEIMVGRIDEVGIGDVPLVSLVKQPPPGYRRTMKTVLDVVMALLLLAVFFPLWALLALAVKTNSPGPIFYRQARVGKDGREYTMLKFRTMYEGAEAETGPVLSSPDDERVTPLGRFLRRFRLDEIPQLLNILAGHMSFVGPRPERPELVNRYSQEIAGYDERFAVRPGLTGLAQVYGSYATTTENKLKFDLLYIQNQSLLLDLKIIARTLSAVLSKKGSTL